jgi:hypothetical protein
MTVVSPSLPGFPWRFLGFFRFFLFFFSLLFVFWFGQECSMPCLLSPGFLLQLLNLASRHCAYSVAGNVRQLSQAAPAAPPQKCGCS